MAESFDEFHGRVAVYGTWSVFDNIFNKARSGLVMQTGWTPPVAKERHRARDALLRRLYETTTRFDEEDVDDSLLQVPLLDYVKSAKPRVLFVGYGETDNWAHQGRYDLVLDSAHRMDGFVKELWDTMQAMPEYRGTHHVHHHLRSRPRQRAHRVEGARCRGEGLGERLDRGDRPRHSAAWASARTPLP